MPPTKDQFPLPDLDCLANSPIAQELSLYLGQIILKGFAPTKSYTVSEWIDHVIDAKESTGRKKKTINGYHYHAIRIKQLIGERDITQIQPSDITELMNTLKGEKVIAEPRAQLRDDVTAQDFLDRAAISKTALAEKAGIAQPTVDAGLRGKRILLEKARSITDALGIDFGDMFEEVCIDRTLSQTTLDDYRRFLNIIFSAAERELIILHNPVARAERPIRPKKQKSVKTLQLHEVKQVLEAVEHEPLDKRCLIHLFLITGGRLGEICGLRWSRVFWEDNTILIDHQVMYLPGEVYSEDSTKTGQDRLIRLPDETMKLLQDYRHWQAQRATRMAERWVGSDYIFTNRTGERISPATICTYVKRFQEKYNLPPIHPHKFRHTHASILLYSGMDIVRVSKRLGHLDVSTTLDYYAHMMIQADIESAECIGDIIYRTPVLTDDRDSNNAAPSVSSEPDRHHSK